jgi:hypothetical protein
VAIEITRVFSFQILCITEENAGVKSCRWEEGEKQERDDKKIR